MKKVLFILIVPLLLNACATKPPKPPRCVDDGRGMIPVNLQRISDDDVDKVARKYRGVSARRINRMREQEHVG